MFKSTKWGAIHTTLDGDSPSFNLTVLGPEADPGFHGWRQGPAFGVFTVYLVAKEMHEGSNLCLCLRLRDAGGSKEQAAYSEGQEWQQGLDKAHSPASCCPLAFSSNVGQPCPAKALHGHAQLLRCHYFTSVVLLFISPFLSSQEGMVLMSLFTSLSFFECNSLFPLPPEHEQILSLLQQCSVLALRCSLAQCHTHPGNQVPPPVL